MADGVELSLNDYQEAVEKVLVEYQLDGWMIRRSIGKPG